MKFNIYAIKDVEKGVYLQPFFIPFYQKTEDTIIDFKRNLQAAESIISKFPNNFQLWKIGEFMDETGMFIDCSKVLLIEAADLLKEKEEDVGNTEIN